MERMLSHIGLSVSTVGSEVPYTLKFFAGILFHKIAKRWLREIFMVIVFRECVGFLVLRPVTEKSLRFLFFANAD